MTLFYRRYLDIELVSVLGVSLSKQRQESMHMV